MTQESPGEGGEAIPGRRADDNITPEMIERALGELTEIVRARLPERFYRGEGHWPLLAAAMVSLLERAGHEKRLSTILRLARALGIPAARLLDGVR